MEGKSAQRDWRSLIPQRHRCLPVSFLRTIEKCVRCSARYAYSVFLGNGLVGENGRSIGGPPSPANTLSYTPSIRSCRIGPITLQTAQKLSPCRRKTPSPRLVGAG